MAIVKGAPHAHVGDSRRCGSETTTPNVHPMRMWGIRTASIARSRRNPCTPCACGGFVGPVLAAAQDEVHPMRMWGIRQMTSDCTPAYVYPMRM